MISLRHRLASLFSWRGRRLTSIRARVLAIVLVPSTVLLIAGVGIPGYLVSDAAKQRTWASHLDQTRQLTIIYSQMVQTERRLSMLAVGRDQAAIAQLPAVRANFDKLLGGINQFASVMTDLGMEAMLPALGSLNSVIPQLPVIRNRVDTGQISLVDVDAFYTQFANVSSIAYQGIVYTAPDPDTAHRELTVADLFQVVEAQNRADALAAGAVATGRLTPSENLQFAQQVGAYRQQLAGLAFRLTGDEGGLYQALISSDAWKTLQSAENSVIQTGDTALSSAALQDVSNQVSTGLLNLWSQFFQKATQGATANANTALTRSVTIGIAAILVAVAALLIAIRLANRLVRRLQALHSKTLELADERLPSIVQRLRDGVDVDVDSEVDPLDEGVDEIGQVANAFNKAQRTAISAAAAEAKTRGGINKVFLAIAHRSQVVVHRQLEVLDIAEAKQSDPEHLQLLFQLDHLTTHARRNAENLLILGGGQPGRKWRNPVALDKIVRSAISETENFERVSPVRLPQVRLLGVVVADLIHLLAELVDNATSFSPPDSPVTLRGNLVGKGVVVEVEDQGLGIPADEREEFNETLRNPPDFEAMALAGQRRLGLFVVAQLAARHDVTVTLVESAYGGIKAIVLIPAKAIAPDDERDDNTMTVAVADEAVATVGVAMRAPRHRQNGMAAPESVPAVAAIDSAGEWPVDEPVESIFSSPGWQSPDDVGRSTRNGNGHAPRDSSNGVRDNGSPAWASGPQDLSQRPRRPLPRRRRQANLAPQLQVDAPPAAETTNEPRQTRSPEQARNSMASFQRGTLQGRRDTSSGQHNL
ncbi:MAG TPA: nitrate- and nitrite sensing domain-containing protein [Amycolatopsis sp.]|nr:nitrate- and nitrite sensing domain-containing protein [Amycolatopsis sp.]